MVGHHAMAALIPSCVVRASTRDGGTTHTAYPGHSVSPGSDGMSGCHHLRVEPFTTRSTTTTTEGTNRDMLPEHVIGGSPHAHGS